MNVTKLLAELEAQRGRVQRAVEALTALDGSVPLRRRSGPRKMSPEARKKISDAQKKRWAEQKKKKNA
jgi:hypothetical protein